VVAEAVRFRRIPAVRLILAMILAATLALASLLVATESSYAATTLVVNSTGDAGDNNTTDDTCFTGNQIPSGGGGGGPVPLVDECTLRAAIQQANATTGADTINFNIPTTDANDCDAASGVCTITPNSSLPDVQDQLTIDGYSQRPCSSNPAPCSRRNTLAKGTNAVLLIELDGSNAVDTDFFGNEVPGSGLIVRSTSTITGLVINRFGGGGMFLGANTTVQGNFIGTDPSGTQGLGNGFSGVDHGLGGAGSVIGGTSPGARNLISGNNGVGVASGQDNGHVVVQGNLIGTQRDGVSPLGNSGSGVGVGGFAASHTIGGTTPAAANTMAFNGGDGVAVDKDARSNHSQRILSNSIFSNAGLGIDLADDGRTANDLDDADTGANNLQNYPVLTSAKTSRKGTIIRGTLESTPSTSATTQTFVIQFFSNPKDTNEGKTYLGQKSVSTSVDGFASFTFKTKKKVGAGQNITATATNDSTGETSEFSGPKKVRRG
jgi:CSLREA domain-containing protein